MPPPREEGGDERDDVRHEEERLEVARPAQGLAVQQQGEREGQEQPDGERDRGEAEGDEERVPGPRVVEQVGVVLEADEADRVVLDQVEFVNVKTNVATTGTRVSKQESDDPRADERIAPQRLAPREA